MHVSKCFIASFFVLHLTIVVALNATTASFYTSTIQIDDQNSFQVAVFNVSFNEDIYFGGRESTSFSATATNYSNAAMCVIDCATLSESSYRQLGAVELVCGDKSFTSTADNSVPSIYLIPTPPNSDPLLSLFHSIGYITADVGQQISRTFSAILLLEVIDGGILLNFTTPRPNISELSQCSLRFGGPNALINITDVSGGTFTNNESLQLYSPQCVYNHMAKAVNNVQAIITNISSATTWDQLEQFQLQAELWMQSNAIVACKDIALAYTEQKLALRNHATTTECFVESNDPAWLSDPCCNHALLWSTCCLPRNTTSLDSVFYANEDKSLTNLMQQQCHHPDSATAVISDYTAYYNTAIDPNLGCEATAFRVANEPLWDSYSQFIQQCFQRVFGIGYFSTDASWPCKNDSDCYTSCDAFLESCVVPWSDPDPYIIQCHLDFMDPVVKQYLRVLLNVSDNTDDSLAAAYYSQLRTENCIGAYSGTYSDDNVFIHINNKTCLSDAVCSSNSYIPNAFCAAQGPLCALCPNEIICEPVSIPQGCFVYSITNENDCIAAVNGTWAYSGTGDNCMLDIYSADECVPSSLCPLPEKDANPEYQYQCVSSFCYTSDNEATCTSNCSDPFIKKWTPLSNTSSLCLVGATTEANCLSVNGADWWFGRWWQNGSFLTEESCAQGICKIGEYFIIDITKEACTSTYVCSTTCKICSSQIGISACVSNLTGCACTKDSGVYSEASGCTYSYTEADCAAHNYSWRDCSQLNSSVCTLCAEGSPGCPETHVPLNCAMDFNGECDTKEICETPGMGQCSDDELQYNDSPDCANLALDFIGSECLGVCQYNFTIESNGLRDLCEPEGYTGSLGCINATMSYEECLNTPGYFWTNASWTQAECESRIWCSQAGRAALTPKSPSLCKSCGGTPEYVYRWQQGQWTPGVPYPLYWKESKLVPANSYGLTLDYNLLLNAINMAIATKFALAIQTKAMCMYGSSMTNLLSIACDCSGDPLVPSSCYPDGVRSVTIGVQRFCNGLPDGITTGALELTIQATTIPASSNCLDLSIELYSATQFARSYVTLSTSVLQNVIQNQNNPYAIITNQNGAVVAQLVGDGTNLQFKKLDGEMFISELAATMQLCMTPRDDIPVSDEFSVLDFATSDDTFSFWQPLELQVSSVSGQYCAEVLTGGVYFPIERVVDWRTRKLAPVLDDTSSAFTYIVGILFLVLAVFTAFQLYLIVWHKEKFHFQKVILSLIVLFCSDRGIYYTLTPSGIMSRAPNAVIYLLSEWPIYIFMSIFSAMIFFWADLVHFWKMGAVGQHGNTVMGKLKVPLLVLNAALYVVFISIIIAFFSVDVAEQKQLRLAYQLLVACVCICLIVGVAIYGGKIWWTNQKAASVMKAGRKRKIIKFSAVLGVSMLSLSLQVAYLLVNAFTVVKDITLALTYSFIVELFPCAVLVGLFMTKSITRRATATTSTGSGSGSADNTTNNENDVKETSTSNLTIELDSVTE